MDDIDALLKAGADKVSLNSAIVRNPNLITEASKRFGSQAVVAAIDVKTVNNIYKVFVKGGKEETEVEGLSWCKKTMELGAGEILLTSMDKDGTRSGYDINLLKKVGELVFIPVIASGGAGSKKDFLDAFKFANVDACLAAGLFHYNELSINELKKYLIENGINIRP